MLRKTRKLNLAWSENQNFFRSFKRRAGQNLQIYTREIPNKSTISRTSVVVGKKVSLLATHRNNLKRKIYQILEQLKTWRSGQDRVIVVRQAASIEKYLEELKHLLS